MKKTSIAAALLLYTLCACADGAQQPPGQATDTTAAAPASRDEEIFRATLARARQEGLDTLPIGEVIARVGSWFVGTPYTPGTLEEPGAEHLVVNLREFDCVTFVENMLAFGRMIRSGQTSFDEFKEQLRTIRYRDGRLDDYTSRLHYFSEWISNNQQKGIVQNVTRALGGVRDPRPLTFMTENRSAYRQLSDSAFFHAIRDHEIELSKQPRYKIPEQQIAAVANGIRNGDVIAATTNVRGLDVAHTGIAIWQNGQLHLMHAPLVGDSVEISELPLAERIIGIGRQDGIMVARPLEPAQPAAMN